MKQTFYEINNSKIKFCSTSYEFDVDSKLHYLSFIAGNIGEINNFDNIITKDYSEIESFLKEIKKRYPDEVKQKNKVRLSLLINKNLRQLDAEKFENLLDHFLETTKYATIFSGQGEFDDVSLIKLNNDYHIDFELIDKDLFFKVYLDLMGTCGLKRTDFSLNKISSRQLFH